MSYLLILIPFVAGISISIQSALNGSLGGKTGTIVSAFLSFTTGSLLLTVYVIFFGKGDFFDVVNAPLWQYLAAVCGIIFISVMVYVVPRIGVTAATVTIIIGQLAASLAIDNFGWFLTDVHSFGIKRFIGVILLLASLYFVYRGKPAEEEAARSEKQALQ